MRATLVRIALLAAFVGIAAPAAAQHSGPCPPGPISVSAGPRATPEPIDCLFAPNGEIRAALYPATVFESSARVHVFRDDAGYRSSLSDHPDEVLIVPRVNRFSDLDLTTLEQIEGTADVQETTPDGARLRLASYAPTTPSTQSATADVRVISRGYDDFDRLSTETVQLQSGGTATLSYTYWNNGQRKTVTDALGRVTFYEYDGRNRLSRLTASQGLPDERVTTYTYWPDSLLKSVTKPDGTVTSYGYDHADRLKSIAVRKGDAELLSYAYVYDANGNRTEQVERNGGAPETTTYTYDDLNRLETVTYPDGRHVAYGYDDVGNRTSETERDSTGTVISEKVAVFDRTNRLSTVTDTVNPANNATFAYDSNGNLERKTTAAGTETYAYDVRDQLVEARAGASISGRFAYDAFGRRYLKIGSEGLRQYLYDQTSLLEEFNETNVEVAKYEWGADRLVSLARLEEPRRFFHFDALGSVAALTEESGSVAARYHYDAWGRHRDPAELDASANRFGFTGHYFDAETKLYYAKARYFDPDFGRFLTQDTYLGEIGDPPSLHRYLYASDRPTFYVDPTGHIVREAFGIDEPQGFWSAFGKNVAYSTLNTFSLGALGRQDKLADQNLAGKISDAQYWGRTAINAGSSVAIAVASAASGGAAGGAASAVATRLGAGALAEGLTVGAAAGFGAGFGGAVASDIAEVAGTGTKELKDVSAKDWLASGAMGAVLGAPLGGAGALGANLNPNIAALQGLDSTVVGRATSATAGIIETVAAMSAEAGSAVANRAMTVVESAPPPTPATQLSGRDLSRYRDLDYMERVTARSARFALNRAQAIEPNQRAAGRMAEGTFENYGYQVQQRLMAADSPYRITLQPAADSASGARVLARTEGSFLGRWTPGTKRLDYGFYSRFQGRANTAPILSGGDFTVTPGGGSRVPSEYTGTFPNARIYGIDPEGIFR